MRPKPLVAVRDVQHSSCWYQQLLGCRSGHAGSQHECLVRDDQVVLQLHQWYEHSHPNLSGPDLAPHGFGVLLWFETDQFDDLLLRVWALGAEIVEEPHVNERAKHREVWVRDPDGYVVVLSSPFGDIEPRG